MDTADTHNINFTVIIFLYLHALSNMTTQTHRIAKTAGIDAHTGPPETSNIYPPNSKAKGICNSMFFNSSFIAANDLGLVIIFSKADGIPAAIHIERIISMKMNSDIK